MDSGLSRTIDRFRQPEYTGENRCIPCTSVNVVIALVLAGAVAGVGVVLGVQTVLVTGVAGAVLVLSGLSIWLRGYLVPGTPSLTKQYFPDWLLAKFDKGPAAMDVPHEGDDAHGPDPIQDQDVGINPHQVLVDGGLVQQCVEEDDLCLAEGVRDAWEEEMAAVDEADRTEVIAEFLEADPERVDVRTKDDVVFVRVGGITSARWESDAALVADLAGDRLLERRIVGWNELPVAQRAHVAGGLRAFVERCPACEGAVELGEDTVESCCRSHDVYAITCESCESRILEVPQAG